MSFRFVENRVVAPRASSSEVASKNEELDAKAVALAELFRSHGVEFHEWHYDLVNVQKLSGACEYIAQSMKPKLRDWVKNSSPERIQSKEFAAKYMEFFYHYFRFAM